MGDKGNAKSLLLLQPQLQGFSDSRLPGYPIEQCPTLDYVPLFMTDPEHCNFLVILKKKSLGKCQ